MAEIEIFLIPEKNKSPISFLSVPRSDIERLAISPFQWLRYVMFAICGVRGDLSTVPDGLPVNYENTEIAHDQYCYEPLGDCVFIDHEGTNDRGTTTSEGTVRRARFRDDIIRRDGHFCVVTGERKGDCDAAHLIPHSKGDEYIKRVMRLRSPDGGSASRIDMTENGILLSKSLHSKHGRGEVAFIKTPNHELRPDHIKRFSRGDEREVYITLQWITMPEDFNPIPLENFRTLQKAGSCIDPALAHNALQNVDAIFQGEEGSLPSTVILNYVYGVAAYKAWRSGSNRGDGFDEVDAYRDKHYAWIPSNSTSSPYDTDDDNVDSGTDDPEDADYQPGSQEGLEEAMDELNTFFMRIQGITPEIAAERREKEIEQEEQAAQEVSRSKVMEWMDHAKAC